MKTKLFILCLLASTYCYAQRDYCSEIRTTSSELTGKTFYMAKAEWLTKNACIIPLGLSINGNKSYSINLKMFSEVLSIDLEGAYFKFSDGSLYKNEKIKMKVEVNDSGRYEYSAILILTDDLLNKLTTLKLTDINYAFSGDMHLSDESSEALRQHFICLKAK